MVLAPFAGCATTLVAAERLRRQWVGIDIWDNSQTVVLQRRERTADRDAAIVAAVQNGESFRAVARMHKLSLSTVYHIVSRSVG